MNIMKKWWTTDFLGSGAKWIFFQYVLELLLKQSNIMVIAFSVLNKEHQRNSNMDFKVLSTCRKMLSRTGISSESCVQIGRIKISNIFVRIAFMLPMNLSLVVITAFCLEEGFNLKRIAVSVGLALGIIQMDLIFFCLAYQKPSTTKILANFQRIVEESEYLIHHKKRDFNEHFLYFFLNEKDT